MKQILFTPILTKNILALPIPLKKQAFLRVSIQMNVNLAFFRHLLIHKKKDRMQLALQKQPLTFETGIQFSFPTTSFLSKSHFPITLQERGKSISSPTQT